MMDQDKNPEIMMDQDKNIDDRGGSFSDHPFRAK
jgi:hypothetical protein